MTRRLTASIASGLTYVVAAGNSNDDAQYTSPAGVPAALTVGAVDWAGSRWQSSNWGRSVDLFAPGVTIASAVSGNGLCQLWDGSNTSTCIPTPGTSYVSPHVAGAVALYLQGRTGRTGCGTSPVQGSAPGPSFGEFSTCADRVARFVNANANLNRLNSINGTIYDQNNNPIVVPSPNRFLWTVAFPTRTNPIDNHRFFVWQQYADFIGTQPQPDESGLDWWTNEIIGHGHCTGVGVNDNNACTDVWRVLTSRAFWIATRGDMFTSSYGLQIGKNGPFVELCYQLYLRRNPDQAGYNFWLNHLSSNYGDPANSDGVFNLIDAFIRSGFPDGYRRRFGQ